MGFSRDKIQDKTVLRFNMGTDPLTIDPRKARDVQALAITRMLFDGLVRINVHQKPELSLAKEMEISSDGRVYTFMLRDAHWGSGEIITARDFINAWKKVLDPQFPASQAFLMFGITNARLAKEGKVSLEEVGIRAINDKTLRIELIDPLPCFLELLATPGFYPVPSNIDEKLLDVENKGSGFIGNGPFMLDKWQRGNSISIIKNPHYWDKDCVKLQKIELFMVNETTELFLFEQGELDWAGSPLSLIPPSAIVQLKKEGKLRIMPGCGTIFFRINVQDPSLKSSLIRRALSLALRKSDLVEHVLQGGQIPANTFIPPSLLKQQRIFAEGDAKLAQELLRAGLEELKITKEQLPKISLIYINSERNHLIAQAGQQNWQEILGVVVSLQAVDRACYFDSVGKGNYQIGIADWIGDYNDPINFLEIFKSKNPPTNNAYWAKSAYDALLDRAVHTQDAAARQDVFLQCESILSEEMPIIPICYHSWVYMANPRLKDMVFLNLGNLDWKWAYKE
jgi:oligopeptide transport system substrate-binding protein